MSTSTYSEKERADQALLQDILIDRVATRVTDVPPGDTVVFAVNITPPTRCADGTRRPQVIDYIDYLFPNPDIESLMTAACARYPRTSQTLSVSGTIVTGRFSVSKGS